MLIFNADDFGLTVLDVERILHSLDHGVIKSTSIAANTVTEPQLKELRGRAVSSGIHINLVEGSPLSGAASFIDGRGRLLDKRSFLRKLVTHRIDQRQIEDEIRMQFERLLDWNIAISHIDSHQNMHFIPQVLRAVAKVSGRYKVGKMRSLDAECFWFSRSYSHTKILAKKVVVALCNRGALGNMTTPDATVLNAPGLGFNVSSIQKALELWDRALNRYYDPDGVYEIPCHMLLSDSEFELYNSDEFKCLLKRYEIKVGDFNEV